jgi:hypothetical protein
MAEQKKKRQSIAEMKRELQDMQIASRRRQEGKQATGESVAQERETAGMGKSSKPEDRSKYVSPSGKQYAGPGYSAGSAPSAPKKPEAAKPAAKPAPKPQQAAPVKPTAPAKPAKETTPKIRVPSLFDRRKMTPATSELFIGDKAAQAMKEKPKTKTKPKRRGQGSRR